MRIHVFIIGVVFLCALAADAQQEVGHYTNIQINTKDIKCSENYLYVADGYHFKAVDVSNPAKPVDVAEINLGWPHSINRVFVERRWAYILVSNNSGGQPGLHMIDISNPEEMYVAGYQPGHFLEIFVSGGHAFICTLDEFQIWDVADPKEIIQIGYGLSLPEIQPYSLFKQGDHCYVTSSWLFGGSYLTIYNVSNVHYPYATAALPDAYGAEIWVSGGYCFTVSGAEFRTYDVSNPEAPFEAALFHLPDSSRDVCIQNDRAYVVGYETPFSGTPALWCLDISDPLDVSLEWEFIQTGSHVVWVEGDDAYLGCSTLGISIIDIAGLLYHRYKKY